jgi:hypothetical protein
MACFLLLIRRWTQWIVTSWKVLSKSKERNVNDSQSYPAGSSDHVRHCRTLANYQRFLDLTCFSIFSTSRFGVSTYEPSACLAPLFKSHLIISFLLDPKIFNYLFYSK